MRGTYSLGHWQSDYLCPTLSLCKYFQDKGGLICEKIAVYLWTKQYLNEYSRRNENMWLSAQAICILKATVEKIWQRISNVQLWVQLPLTTVVHVDTTKIYFTSIS